LSGKVIHAGTVIGCPHGGRAAATGPGGGTRAVLVDGQPVATGAAVHAVTGCRHTVDGVPVPCTGVRWTPASGGVLVDGSPLLLENTPGLCLTAGLVPQGAPVVTATEGEGVTCG